MKETLLLFGFDTEKQKKLVRSLMPLRMKLKSITAEEYHQPIGHLAGIKEILPAEEPSSEQPLALDGEMMVMAGLTSQRIDQVLTAIRNSGTGPIPYKAVLTQTNQNWDAYALLAELKREHEEMTRGRS